MLIAWDIYEFFLHMFWYHLMGVNRILVRFGELYYLSLLMILCRIKSMVLKVVKQSYFLPLKWVNSTFGWHIRILACVASSSAHFSRWIEVGQKFIVDYYLVKFVRLLLLFNRVIDEFEDLSSRCVSRHFFAGMVVTLLLVTTIKSLGIFTICQKTVRSKDKRVCCYL
jgi:hypothetical protein